MSSDKQALNTSTPLLQEDSLAPDATVLLESQNELKEITQPRSRSRPHLGNEVEPRDSQSPIPVYNSVNQVSAHTAPSLDPAKDEVSFYINIMFVFDKLFCRFSKVSSIKSLITSHNNLNLRFSTSLASIYTYFHNIILVIN